MKREVTEYNGHTVTIRQNGSREIFEVTVKDGDGKTYLKIFKTMRMARMFINKWNNGEVGTDFKPTPTMEVNYRNCMDIEEAFHAMACKYRGGMIGFSVMLKSQYRPSFAWSREVGAFTNKIHKKLLKIMKGPEGYWALDIIIEDVNYFVGRLND